MQWGISGALTIKRYFQIKWFGSSGEIVGLFPTGWVAWLIVCLASLDLNAVISPWSQTIGMPLVISSISLLIVTITKSTKIIISCNNWNDISSKVRPVNLLLMLNLKWSTLNMLGVVLLEILSFYFLSVVYLGIRCFTVQGCTGNDSGVKKDRRWHLIANSSSCVKNFKWLNNAKQVSAVWAEAHIRLFLPLILAGMNTKKVNNIAC